jgi:hypothetical protein
MGPHSFSARLPDYNPDLQCHCDVDCGMLRKWNVGTLLGNLQCGIRSWSSSWTDDDDDDISDKNNNNNMDRKIYLVGVGVGVGSLV